MIVRDVVKKGRSVYVKFDNDEQLVIPYDLFVHNYLVKNDEISVKQKNDLQLKIELYKIKQSSLRYLSGRNHSKYELYLKLIKKKYSKNLVNQILNDLEGQKLINDKDFANDYFSLQVRKKSGILKIKADLFKKGVKREIIDFVVNEQNEESVFLESAKLLCERKYHLLKKRNLDNNQVKQRIYQYLSGRGFTANIIFKVINQLEFENNDESIF